MKAFPALRTLAVASLFSLVGVTTSSAQLSFHVYDKDSAHVDSNNNLGVAVDITFNFSITGTVGTLTLTIKNLAGQSKIAADGIGNYTGGILTGFGFDLPGSVGSPDTPSISYANTATSFLQFSNDPDGINFAPTIPFDETNPQAVFDFGAVTTSPQPVQNGLGEGKTATFVIKFNGANTSNFTDSTFFANNGSDADFGFRFQSIPVGAGSDKFVYYIDTPPIPEPSTYGLFAAAGLVGMIGVRRYRSSKKAVTAA
jgi:hypothetical protein